ncbi:GPO family capsid scaffolding protein [Maridesulfovibrio ferrireducens]|uniref:GPO family capsid scaffolding protein n=1 Tax=Maridesulfovibrio ferrireducens TaxID=246191 RepID=UPI001A1E6BCA|nr:GPO family capsid scaffolding protein [Maridesulfovibrio ferrireducens]MBI9109898.1 GPO family capsid scaffolding protein [Maridesulfovibrio ferrireducens]
MSKLITGFIKIGQSGPTADGRTIEAAWLKEAAASYDLDQYVSLIWPEHFRFFGNAGKVVELKAEEKDGITSLYAKLQPGEQLLAYNKSRQKLFTSMELDSDFAKSGKCYLTGLAVTDSPASLGTHELMFSHRKQNEKNIMLCGVELDANSFSQAEAADEFEPPSWFKKFMSQFGSNNSHVEKKEPENFKVEDTEQPMNAEQFKQLNDSIAGLGVQFSALAESMKPGKGEVPAEGVNEQPADAAEPDKFSELSAQMKELTTSVKDFTSRLEGAAGSTPVPENDGAAADGGLI